MDDFFPCIISFASDEMKYENRKIEYNNFHCNKSIKEFSSIKDIIHDNHYKWHIILLLGSYAGKDSINGNYILDLEVEDKIMIDGNMKMSYLDCFDIPRIESNPIPIMKGIDICSKFYEGYQKSSGQIVKPCCEIYENRNWLNIFVKYAWNSRYIIIFLTSGWIDSKWTFQELILYRELIKLQPNKQIIIITDMRNLETDYLGIIERFFNYQKKIKVHSLINHNIIEDYINIINLIDDTRSFTNKKVPSTLLNFILEMFHQYENIFEDKFISLRKYKCILENNQNDLSIYKDKIWDIKVNDFINFKKYININLKKYKNKLDKIEIFNEKLINFQRSMDEDIVDLINNVSGKKHKKKSKKNKNKSINRKKNKNKSIKSKKNKNKSI